MTSPLKTAVIGCGYLGRFHAQKYAQLPNSELIAVCDLNKENAEAVAEEVGCEAHTQISSFIDQVDALSIACTTSAHYLIAKQCLEAGKHVLLEKPMTTTLQEADELIAIAKAKNLILQIGHLERFNPSIQEIKPWLKEPRFISCSRLASFKRRCSDVSVILDLMIHDIDLVQSMVNSPIADVQAIGESVLSDYIDLANARIQFENGCVANFTASRINHRNQRTLHIAQADSYVDIDMQNGHVKYSTVTSETSDGIRIIDRELRRTAKADALLDEITEFLACIKENRQPAANGDAGREALKTALTILESVHKHNELYPH